MEHNQRPTLGEVDSAAQAESISSDTILLDTHVRKESQSAIRLYQEMVVGSASLLYLIRYELITLLVGSLPGALGMVLRRLLYPSILGRVGRGVVFGRNMTIRHGPKIHIGSGVVFDDGATLDAKGAANDGITIGDESIISRNATLSCKNGNILIGKRCAVGINCILHASEGSGIRLGDDVLIGAFAYLVGSGGYEVDTVGVPFKQLGICPKGGIVVSDNVWIGSGTHILDGSKLAEGAIVGSQSLVNRSVGTNEIVGGVPIKLLRKRGVSAAG